MISTTACSETCFANWPMKQMLIQLTNSTTTTFGLWNKSIQTQPATALKSRFWVMINLTTFGNRPAVLTEIFPHLFTQGRGYYNLANAQGDPHTSDEPGEGVCIDQLPYFNEIYIFAHSILQTWLVLDNGNPATRYALAKLWSSAISHTIPLFVGSPHIHMVSNLIPRSCSITDTRHHLGALDRWD